LATETAGVTGGNDGTKFGQKLEEDGLEEVPVFGAAGKESAEPEVVAFAFVNIDDGEVALAGGGDIEAKSVRALGLKEFEEGFVEDGRG